MPPDRLVELVGETGGITELRYRPKGDWDGSLYLNGDLPFNVWTMTERAVYPGVAGPVMREFHEYRGAAFDVASHKFLGFRRVNTETQNTPTVTYRVERVFETGSVALAGKPDRIEHYSVESGVATRLLRQRWIWDCKDPTDGSDQSCFTSGVWPQLKRRIENRYGTGGGASTLESENLEWQQCSGRHTGFPSRIRESGGGLNRYTNIEYACPSGANNLVASPKRVGVSAFDVTGGPLSASESWFFFDDSEDHDTASKGAVTRVESWLNAGLVEGVECARAGARKCIVASMSYDNFGNLLTQTDPNGRILTVQYDSWGIHPETVIEPWPKQHKVSFDYDEKCGTQLYQTTKYVGATQPATRTDLDYDNFCRLAAVTRPLDGQPWRKFWYDLGDEAAATRTHIETREPESPTGYTSSFVFLDALGRAIQEQRFAVVDGAESMLVSRTKYDSRGRVLSSYEPYSLPGFSSDPLPDNGFSLGLTEYEYDVLNRVTKVTNPDGAISRTEYLQPLEVSHRDECYESGVCLGRRVVNVRDEFGRTREVKVYTENAGGGDTFYARTEFGYDVLDRLRSEGQGLTEATLNASSTRSYNYDTLGRLISRTDPASSGTWSFGYDLAGNLIHEDDPESGQSIQICYDALNRPREKHFLDSDTSISIPFSCLLGSGDISYTYDSTDLENRGIGRLTSVDDPSGSTTFRYDHRGRITATTKVIDVLGVSKSAQFVTDYDLADRPILITYPDSELHSLDYDVTGQLTSLGGFHTYLSDATYDRYGRPREVMHGNGVSDTFEYAGGAFAARLSRIRTHKDDAGCADMTTCMTDLQFQNYRPDGLVGVISDHRTEAGLELSATGVFSYDGLGRLTDNLLGNAAAAYAYDGLGRMTNKEGDAVGWHGTNIHSPSSFGVAMPIQTDDNGNIEAKGTTLFDYTHEDRLSLVDILVGGETVEFLYDFAGTRVAKIVNGTEVTRYFSPRMQVDEVLGTTDAVVTKYYFFRGSRLASNRRLPHEGATYADASERLPIRAGGSMRAGASVWGFLLSAMILVLITLPSRRKRVVGVRPREGQSLLIALAVFFSTCPFPNVAAGQCPDPPPTGFLRHYHPDHLGSIFAVTNSDGGIVEQIRYSNYGEVRGRWDVNGSPVANVDPAFRYEFTGYETELTSGLMYAQARFYDPQLGMFLTHDPVGEFSNPHSYVGWSPINFVDPSGRGYSRPDGGCSASVFVNYDGSGFSFGDVPGNCGGGVFGDQAPLRIFDVSPSNLSHCRDRPCTFELSGSGGSRRSRRPPSRFRATVSPTTSVAAVVSGVGKAIAISSIPGGGEFLDLQTILDPTASALEVSLATLSLTLNTVAPYAPNYGALRSVGEVPEVLYHYTQVRNVSGILDEGIVPGASGRVFLTPSRDLSALQAQLDLALPPNGLREAVLEIDVTALRRLGVEVPPASQVGRSFNLPGGGLEVAIGASVPPDLIRRVR